MYRNDSDQPIEAKYVFPLDENAAVCGYSISFSLSLFLFLCVRLCLWAFLSVSLSLGFFCLLLLLQAADSYRMRSFEAFINERHVVAEVKEKEQARREYKYDLQPYHIPHISHKYLTYNDVKHSYAPHLCPDI
jgi:glucan phosphoethanolaminetransferase (alkaline phosphatase superfamily)